MQIDDFTVHCRNIVRRVVFDAMMETVYFLVLVSGLWFGDVRCIKVC